LIDRHKKVARIPAGPITTDGGNSFDHTGMIGRPNGRDDQPVLSVLAHKMLTITRE
jgi:hypothetical protein